MNIPPQPTGDYPPRVWENNYEFTPPGPVSRVVADYLAMCAPPVAFESPKAHSLKTAPLNASRTHLRPRVGFRPEAFTMARFDATQTPPTSTRG